MKITLNSRKNRDKTQKAQKDKKSSFPNVSVETADFYKSVLNKIIATYEYCIKYNFVAQNPIFI